MMYLRKQEQMRIDVAKAEEKVLKKLFCLRLNFTVHDVTHKPMEKNIFNGFLF